MGECLLVFVQTPYKGLKVCGVRVRMHVESIIYWVRRVLRNLGCAICSVAFSLALELMLCHSCSKGVSGMGNQFFFSRWMLRVCIIKRGVKACLWCEFGEGAEVTELVGIVTGESLVC